MIKVPNKIGEIREINPEVAVDVLTTLLAIIAEVGIDEKDKLGESINYDYFFGGTPRIVETYEDLKEVEVLVEHESGRWCNITEAVGDMDVAMRLGDNWMLFLLCSNNAGGTGYYVPMSLALSCPNLLLTIQRSNPPALEEHGLAEVFNG